jgi:type I restriction enzyme S subunit
MFSGDKYPHLSLDEIAKEWLKGQGFKKDDICEDGDTGCIHYGELFTKYGPVINKVLSRTSVEKKKTSRIGDILFPASDVTPTGLARCSMLPFDDVVLGGDIIVLRPKNEYNPAYLSYAINQQTSQILTKVNGGVVKHLSAKGLKTIEIPIPPKNKQDEYIQIAQQADKSEYYN